MDNNTNGIAHLAIHILSIIANSAVTEGNFSDFGNIQTKKCSWLSIKKTHKINVVRMDIHCCHASLSLLKCWSKHKLGDDGEPSSTTEDEPPDPEDDSFKGLAQNLIGLAIDDKTANTNEAADKAEDLPVLPSVVVAPSQPCTHRPTCTQTPLATLFNFT